MRLVIGILSNLLFIMITLILSNQAVAMGSYRKSEDKGLYIYSRSEIANFFTNIGYPEFWKEVEITATKADGSTFSFPSRHIEISRNSNGSALRFLNVNTRKFFVVYCDGVIKEIDALHSSQVWLNDDNQIVLWRDGSAGIVHYKNGTYENISKTFGSHIEPDPSGNYFIKYQIAPPQNTPLSEICKTEIYSIESPNFPIAKTSVCNPFGIFFKDGKIFLFGKDYDAENNKISNTITMHVFQIMNTGMIEIEKETIEPTIDNMHVQDFSPWDDKVFLQEDYDPPFRPVLYEYDLGTKKMKKLGKIPFSGGRGFYLQCDLLKEAMKKNKGER